MRLGSMFFCGFVTYVAFCGSNGLGDWIVGYKEGGEGGEGGDEATARDRRLVTRHAGFCQSTAYGLAEDASLTLRVELHRSTSYVCCMICQALRWIEPRTKVDPLSSDTTNLASKNADRLSSRSALA